MAQRDQRPQQVLAAVGHEVVVRVHPQRVVEAVDEAGRLQGKADHNRLHSAPVLQLGVACTAGQPDPPVRVETRAAFAWGDEYSPLRTAMAAKITAFPFHGGCHQQRHGTGFRSAIDVTCACEVRRSTTETVPSCERASAAPRAASCSGRRSPAASPGAACARR